MKCRFPSRKFQFLLVTEQTPLFFKPTSRILVNKEDYFPTGKLLFMIVIKANQLISNQTSFYASH